MKYLKTYEGFLNKIKNLLTPKENPKKKISAGEIKTLIEDRLIELKDDRFAVMVLEGESNSTSLLANGRGKPGVDISFGELSKRFEVIIEKKEVVAVQPYDFFFTYFQFLIFPSEIHSMASAIRLSRVASVLASAIQIVYSFCCEGENFSK